MAFLNRTTAPHFATILFIAGLASLTQSMFLPALNTIALDFDTDFSRLQLVVALYFLATAVLQLVFGPLADRFGRRPVILTSLCFFSLASLGAALSPSAESFILCRVLQASVASGIVLSRAITRDIWSGSKGTAMLGYVGVGVAIVAMIGPLVGGLIGTWLGWRAIFGALSLMGFALFALCWMDQGETAPATSLSFKAQLRQWPVLLSSKRFWLFAGAAGFAQGAYTALLAGTSFVNESVFGLNAIQGGLALAGPALCYAIGAWLLGRIAHKTSLRRLILIGASIATLSVILALLPSLAQIQSPFAFYGALSLLGLGHGFLLPASQAGMMSIKPDLAGTASGLGGAINLGIAAALSAIAGSLLVPGASEISLLVPMVIASALSLLCGICLKTS